MDLRVLCFFFSNDLVCFLMSTKALYKNVPFFGVWMSFAGDLGLDLAVHSFRLFFFFLFLCDYFSSSSSSSFREDLL